MKTLSFLKIGVALFLLSLFTSCNTDELESLEAQDDIANMEFYEDEQSFSSNYFSGKSGGCITCALSKILKEEWRNPNYGGGGGTTTGWTFNLRNRFGRKINAAEIQKLENAINNKEVEKIDRQLTIYGNDGILQYEVVPHLVALKNGEPYFIYQKYIVGLYATSL
ncbi:hypothetical protein [uncultured Aquimarina sp.]|uniref:hypothetical protein n=1 Tax=uncultured Aquimarina sp. TaxID=575652 RepID=UPI002618BCC0|nr:hypothetical protein [uncultured Aquimarina sp.]